MQITLGPVFEQNAIPSILSLLAHLYVMALAKHGLIPSLCILAALYVVAKQFM